MTKGVTLSPELISSLPNWVKWVARDVDDDIIVTDKKPEMEGGMWHPIGKKSEYITEFNGIDPGNCDWKHSLTRVKR